MKQLEALDIPKGIFNNTKICAFVSCHFYGKTQCLYSIMALTSEQKDQIKIYIDQARYTCGECLFPQDHQFGGILFTKQALTCDSSIEVGYYSSRLQKDQLCYYCRSEEFLIDIAILAPDQILNVTSGSKQLKLKPSDWQHYVGERARRGLKLPRAFQKVETLGVVTVTDSI